jgi:hypothetical protein
MQLKVIRTDDGARLSGEAAEEDVEAVNRFLSHLGARAFSPATVRAYAFDLLNFLRFCATRELVLSRVVAADLFDSPIHLFSHPLFNTLVSVLKKASLSVAAAGTGPMPEGSTPRVWRTTADGLCSSRTAG